MKVYLSQKKNWGIAEERKQQRPEDRLNLWRMTYQWGKNLQANSPIAFMQTIRNVKAKGMQGGYVIENNLKKNLMDNNQR